LRIYFVQLRIAAITNNVTIANITTSMITVETIAAIVAVMYYDE
jgi:hypothetical protein